MYARNRDGYVIMPLLYHTSFSTFKDSDFDRIVILHNVALCFVHI